MTENKKTVQTYMEKFAESDHAGVLACLTDNVIWELPVLLLHGKEAFDKEIVNEAFEPKPDIKLIRMVEENDIVVAEGTVQARKKDGTVLNMVFCDIFYMSDGKINKLTSYLMNV